MKVRETAEAYLQEEEEKVYTYRDYLRLPDDGNRYEILGGELIMTPAPIIIHQRVTRRLSLLLNEFVEQKELGEIFFSPIDVVLSDTEIVQPDILFVAKTNLKIIKRKRIKGAPDLIIEIISPTTGYYDLVVKKRIYEKHGVKEYWVVDPHLKWIEIYHWQEGKYQTLARAENSGTVESALLPGWSVDLKHLFKPGPAARTRSKK